jgi:hypothetical protein
MNATIFVVSWLLMGVTYALGWVFPDDSWMAKLNTAVFVAAAAGAIIDDDVMQFLRGAFATISQDGLWLQTRTPVFTFVLAGLFGACCLHLTVARIPGQPIPWAAVSRWTAILTSGFMAGCIVVVLLRGLQAPGQD